MVQKIFRTLESARWGIDPTESFAAKTAVAPIYIHPRASAVKTITELIDYPESPN
jgi:hypothetical protein